MEEEFEIEQNDNKQLHLVYVKLIGENGDGIYEYEAYFSSSPDTIWQESWAEQVPSICGDITPSEGIDKIYKFNTDMWFNCAQDNNCFSMQDCIDGIIKLIWVEDSNGKLILKSDFGETIEMFENKLNEINIQLNKNHE